MHLYILVLVPTNNKMIGRAMTLATIPNPMAMHNVKHYLSSVA